MTRRTRPVPACQFRSRLGFSLVELLVVIGIITVLIAILLPVMGRAQEQARRTQCLSNLRSLGQAMFMYASAHKDHLPNGNPRGAYQDYAGAAQVMIHFAGTYAKSPGLFHCPSDDEPAPEKIAAAGHLEPNSARTSYDFYFLYWPPEHGPILTRLKGKAPLAWDLEGGAAGASTMKNHKGGGNVLYADGHADWQHVNDWQKPNWPDPAFQFFP